MLGTRTSTFVCRAWSTRVRRGGSRERAEERRACADLLGVYFVCGFCALTLSKTRRTPHMTYRRVRRNIFERQEQRHADARDHTQRELRPAHGALARVQRLQSGREKRPDVVVQREVRRGEREENRGRACLEV
jgi:hypothetical protein